jgi:hypothetical protein
MLPIAALVESYVEFGKASSQMADAEAEFDKVSHSHSHSPSHSHSRSHFLSPPPFFFSGHE